MRGKALLTKKHENRQQRVEILAGVHTQLAE